MSKKNSQDLRNLISSLRNSQIPTKYLYDEKGSKLFESICATEEYYLTRSEQQIFDLNARDIFNITKTNELFEFGSGSAKKTRVLILEALKSSQALKYISYDISTKALEMSNSELRNISSNLVIELHQGDFISGIKKIKLSTNNRLYLFLGSTIGNFDDPSAIKLLSNVSNIMKKKDYLLVGVDKIKDTNIISAAYNDKKGITAEFNKNVLSVINKKYNLNFNTYNYAHSALFNKKMFQIEMYLEVIKDNKVKFPNNDTIFFRKGQKILTEISRKFSDIKVKKLFDKSGLGIIKVYNDKKKYFSSYLLKTKN